MHVLFITANRRFLDEKSEEAAYLQAMVAASDALHIVVFSLRKDRLQTRQIGPNAWIYPTNSWSPLLYAFDAWRTIRLQVIWKGEFRSHVVHSDDPLLAGWLGLILAHHYERAWVVNVRRDVWERRRLPNVRAVPLGWLMAFATHVCVFSERTRMLLSGATADPAVQHKIVSFQKAFDPAILRAAPVIVDLKQKYPAYNFIVLVAAPLESGVPIDLALETIAALREIPGYGKAGLIIVGDGSQYRTCERKAQKLALLQEVVFERGAVDLVSYFKSANTLLYLSSGDEEDENAIMAAAAGCVMIALPSPLASQIIKDGETGIIVTEATPGMLVTAIRYYNETPGLRERYKLNSGSHISNVYAGTAESLAEQLRAAWDFVEAPPEGLHLEHELTFAGNAASGPGWSPKRVREYLDTATQKVTEVLGRFRNK